jgi:PAS domain S-box-containing protein
VDASGSATRLDEPSVGSRAGVLPYVDVLLETMDDGVIATDPDFTVTLCNGGAERLYGRPAAELVGRPAREIAALAGDASLARLQRQLGERGRGRVALAVQRRDGIPVDIEISAVAVRAGPDEELIGYLTIHRDVTQRRRLEDERRRLLAVLESSTLRVDDPVTGEPIAIATITPGRAGIQRPEAALRASRDPPTERPAPVTGLRLLLVEEHAAVREAMAAALGAEPDVAEVRHAGSLAEARTMADDVDVAVIDLVLPDGSGADLIGDVRRRSPDAQALMITPRPDRAAAAVAVERGAAGVLSGETHLQELMAAIRRLRRGEPLMASAEVVELLRLAARRRERELEDRRALDRLTARERQVLQLMADGLDHHEAAARLHVSPRTQRNHVANILAKLRVHSQLQALLLALRYGVVVVGHPEEPA